MILARILFLSKAEGCFQDLFLRRWLSNKRTCDTLSPVYVTYQRTPQTVWMSKRCLNGLTVQAGKEVPTIATTPHQPATLAIFNVFCVLVVSTRSFASFFSPRSGASNFHPGGLLGGHPKQPFPRAALLKAFGAVASWTKQQFHCEMGAAWQWELREWQMVLKT